MAFGILPSGGLLHASVGKEGEWVVLAHYAGTRRVAFGVGNAWSLFPRDGRRALKNVFLTALTRGILFVPDTNPL